MVTIQRPLLATAGKKWIDSSATGCFLPSWKRAACGAADKLGTSSGQASKLLSRLEGELGVRLLNRTTRSVSPTEAGRAYYDRLKPLVDELETLDLDIRNINGRPAKAAPDGAADLRHAGNGAGPQRIRFAISRHRTRR